MRNLFVILFGITLSVSSLGFSQHPDSRVDEIEEELIDRINLASQKILEMSAHIQRITGSKHPLSDEAFCKVDPNSADVELREYIESALLMKSGNEKFHCLNGLDSYSKYFSASSSFLYWSSLANNNGEFYDQFVKSNSVCELKRLYPESLVFLNIRGYRNLSNKIASQWRNCQRPEI